MSNLFIGFYNRKNFANKGFWASSGKIFKKFLNQIIFLKGKIPFSSYYDVV